MDIARIVISLLLAALLVATGGGKLASASSSLAIRDSLRVSPPRWQAIGAAELVLVAALVAGVWVRPLGIAALAGVVVLMFGAIATRRSVGGPEQRSGLVADVVVLAMAAGAIALAVA